MKLRMVALVVVPLGALAYWLLLQSKIVARQLKTCRYRDFDRLVQRRGGLITAALGIAALGPFLYPFGLALTVWVGGCLLYTSRD